MIVVSNTSPLTNLAAIGQLGLMPLLFKQIHIPGAVWQELHAGDVTWPGREEVDAATWIVRDRVSASHFLTELMGDLGPGEAEAITLALDIKADLVLLDEKEGRRKAQRAGLRVMGVGGVLLAAKAQHHLAEVRPCLDGLMQIAGFYLSESVYHALLAAANEAPPTSG
jgi:predicted nucleic acid-binding protein